jgi:hypothetical protein
MLIILVAAIGIQTASAPATNKVEASSDTTAISDVSPPETSADARVCRMETVTGSRFRVRVCRTARSVSANRLGSQDMLRQMQGLPDLPPAPTSPNGF